MRPTPKYDAWKLAEQEVKFAEHQWKQAVSQRPTDSSAVHEQVAVLNEKRKTSHALFRLAMEEFRDIAELLRPPGGWY